MHTDHRGHERWRCWSGDDSHRGDAIDLVVATQRVPRGDAVDWLAHRAGMIPDQPLPPVAAQDPTGDDRASSRSTRSSSGTPTACERILWTSTGRDGARLAARTRLRRRHHPRQPHRRRPRPGDVPPPPRPPLRRDPSVRCFPHSTPTGRVSYVQTRYLDPGDGPKYDNPGCRARLQPTCRLDGRYGATQPGVLVVCEGIPDALTAAQAGLRSVAVLGSQAPDRSVATRIARDVDESGMRGRRGRRQRRRGPILGSAADNPARRARRRPRCHRAALDGQRPQRLGAS